MILRKCIQGIQALGVQPQGGRTSQETFAALCLASRSHADFDPKVGLTPDLLGKMTSTAWSGVSKAVEGGISHFLSVDNGAYYAELWSQGENWYAVTGAEVKKGQTGGVWMIPGVVRGMDARDATPLFLRALDKGVFGGEQEKKARKKGDCGC